MDVWLGGCERSILRRQRIMRRVSSNGCPLPIAVGFDVVGFGSKVLGLRFWAPLMGISGMFSVHRRESYCHSIPMSRAAGCLKSTSYPNFSCDHCNPTHSLVESTNMCGTCRYSLHPQNPSTYNISASASAPYSPAEVSLSVARKASVDPVLDSLPCRLPGSSSAS